MDHLGLRSDLVEQMSDIPAPEQGYVALHGFLGFVHAKRLEALCGFIIQSPHELGDGFDVRVPVRLSDG